MPNKKKNNVRVHDLKASKDVKGGNGTGRSGSLTSRGPLNQREVRDLEPNRHATGGGGLGRGGQTGGGRSGQGLGSKGG